MDPVVERYGIWRLPAVWMFDAKARVLGYRDSRLTGQLTVDDLRAALAGQRGGAEEPAPEPLDEAPVVE